MQWALPCPKIRALQNFHEDVIGSYYIIELVIIPLDFCGGLRSTDVIQKLTVCSLYDPQPLLKISLKCIHNFLLKC